MIHGSARANLLLIEQVSQGQRADGPRISAQESATIQREQGVIDRASWYHRHRELFNIKECVAGEHHLAEIGQGAMPALGFGQAGVAGGLGFEESPRGIAFIRVWSRGR